MLSFVTNNISLGLGRRPDSIPRSITTLTHRIAGPLQGLPPQADQRPGPELRTRPCPLGPGPPSPLHMTATCAHPEDHLFRPSYTYLHIIDSLINYGSTLKLLLTTRRSEHQVLGNTSAL